MSLPSSDAQQSFLLSLSPFQQHLPGPTKSTFLAILFALPHHPLRPLWTDSLDLPHLHCHRERAGRCSRDGNEQQKKEESGVLRLRTACHSCARSRMPAGQKADFSAVRKPPAHKGQYFSLQYLITRHSVHSCCAENEGTFCSIFYVVVS